ncbi:DUF2442 domain-containing protein [Petrimonas sp.]|uniref:DUF2442 domain-containing protein n=1 Tax=Petrimonas sp. TaxID=2023866 RepID=UPI003F51088C
MMEVIDIWLTDTAVNIQTADGQTASERFDDYPRLKWATAAQRANYEADNIGIHWPDLDEDLSFEGFFREKKMPNRLYRLFSEHPELNAAAIARRLGMKQSLLAAYITGTKKPSKNREEEIINAVRKVGEELSMV